MRVLVASCRVRFRSPNIRNFLLVLFRFDKVTFNFSQKTRALDLGCLSKVPIAKYDLESSFTFSHNSSHFSVFKQYLLGISEETKFETYTPTPPAFEGEFEY